MEGEKRKPSEAIGHNSTSSAHMPVRFSFHPYKPCSLARFSEPVNPIHGCIPYKGLGGRQAAWAGKQYCSHRLLPSSQHISPSSEMFVEVPSRALRYHVFCFFFLVCLDIFNTRDIIRYFRRFLPLVTPGSRYVIGRK